MTHPLIDQLRFARSEFRRGVEGVTHEEGARRFEPMNCIAWNVGHLAWQEQRYWLFFTKGELLSPEVDKEFAYGAAATTPVLEESLAKWEQITQAADPWLDSVTTETLETHLERNGKPTKYIYGSLLLRLIYHYFYHTGENAAIRQNLGHTDLPEFIGNIDDDAGYRRETA